MPLIDLRSDTVTRPSAAMRAAMAAAPVGDDVYGDDPSVNALEKRVAEFAGMPAALLCASGTQSNLLGLLSHCQRGEEYLVGQEYHTYRYEAGGAAVLGGIVPQPFEVQADGTLDLAHVETRIKPDDPHFPITRLLALENTHTGKVIPQAYFKQARKLVDKHGLQLHLDGARVANAAVAQGLSVADICQPFDSVSICFSKGLGAPIGSVLCGSEVLIQRARRWRKMVGGGMRQAGIIAAAIDYTLDHNLARLADDHALAEALAAKFTELLEGNTQVQVQSQQTNMVYLAFHDSDYAKRVAAALKHLDILVPASAKMRLVTHLDVHAEDIPRILDGFVKALAAAE